jgi:transcriptional regulator with XRE-family HTH domain
MTIGEKIQQLRKANNLSQEDLAAQVGVSRQSISLWEKNQTVPSTDNLLAITSIFKITMDALLREDNELNQKHDGLNNPVATATTKWDLKNYIELSKTIYEKTFSRMIIRSVLCLILGFGVLFSKTPYLCLLFLGIGIMNIIAYIRLKNKIHKQADMFFATEPNRVSNFSFYHDYMQIRTRSDCSSSEYTKKYSDFTLVIDNEKSIALVFDGKMTYIIKASIIGDIPYISMVFQQNAQRYISPTIKKENIKVQLNEKQIKLYKPFLVVILVLTSLSIFMSLMLVGLASGFNLSTSFAKHMWMFYLILPIPLASLILGIWGRKKGLKTKAHIILGIIMTALHIIYGSFSFIF